jgi:hypothetical protein
VRFSLAGHRTEPSTWTGPALCSLCFPSSSAASSSAPSAPVPPNRSPPAPPTDRSCGGTSKSGQVTLLSRHFPNHHALAVPSVVFLTTALVSPSLQRRICSGGTTRARRGRRSGRSHGRPCSGCRVAPYTLPLPSC